MQCDYIVPPGARVAVPVYGVHHEGIASDRFINGEQAVISSSRRAGRALEEPWSRFARGRAVRRLQALSDLHPSQVIANARMGLGSDWGMLNSNCQHFVCKAFGVTLHSPQVWQVGGIVLLGLGLIATTRAR